MLSTMLPEKVFDGSEIREKLQSTFCQNLVAHISTNEKLICVLLLNCKYTFEELRLKLDYNLVF